MKALFRSLAPHDMHPMLERTAAPTAKPLNILELKEHLRISHSRADAHLQAIIDAVCEEIDGPDGYLRRAVMTQTWVAKYRCFPSGTGPWPLPLPPLQGVSSITYFDENNVSQTVNAANYAVHTPAGAAGFVELNFGSNWPSSYDRPDAVSITFVAGYGSTVAGVPQRIRHGLKLLAASLYTNRGDMVGDRGVDPAILDRMLGPHRWREVA